MAHLIRASLLNRTKQDDRPGKSILLQEKVPHRRFPLISGLPLRHNPPPPPPPPCISFLFTMCYIFNIIIIRANDKDCDVNDRRASEKYQVYHFRLECPALKYNVLLFLLCVECWTFYIEAGKSCYYFYGFICVLYVWVWRTVASMDFSGR